MMNTIKHCTRCNGWGLLPQPITHRSRACEACQQNASALTVNEIHYFWDLPSVVNYQERSRAGLKRSVILLMLLAATIAIFSTLIYLLQFSIRNL